MKVFCLLDWFTSLPKLQLSLTPLKFGFKAARSNKSYRFLSSFHCFLPFILFTILDMLRVQAHFPSHLQAVVGLQRWPKHIRL